MEAPSFVANGVLSTQFDFKTLLHAVIRSFEAIRRRITHNTLKGQPTQPTMQSSLRVHLSSLHLLRPLSLRIPIFLSPSFVCLSLLIDVALYSLSISTNHSVPSKKRR